MKRIITFISPLILIAIVACQKIEGNQLVELGDQQILLIEHVDIFDGYSPELIKNQSVLLKDGIIAKIGNYIQSEAGWKLIDGNGKTLLPGFIDAHVHLSGSGAVPWENYKANLNFNLEAYLYAGVTTVYDLGGIGGNLEKIQQKVIAGNIPGPNIYHTHIPITVKNSHPIPLTEQMLPWPLKSMVNGISPTIERPLEAETLLKKYIKSEVDFVKVIMDQIPPGSPEMSYKQLKAIVSEAHNLDKKVIVHIGSPDNAINALKAGADALAHGIWRGELTPQQADEIASYGKPIIYTLSGFTNVAAIHDGKFQPSEIDQELVPKVILDPVTGQDGLLARDQAVMSDFFADVKLHEQSWKSNFNLLLERNVTILVGTDSNLPGTYAGSTYFQELSLLQQFGMAPIDILRGATALNAKLFLSNPNFGTVSEGKKADLILVNGNPLKDLSTVFQPFIILKDGKLINRL